MQVVQTVQEVSQLPDGDYLHFSVIAQIIPKYPHSSVMLSGHIHKKDFLSNCDHSQDEDEEQAPAEEGEYVAVAIKSTEFDKVEAHTLHREKKNAVMKQSELGIYVHNMQLEHICAPSWLSFTSKNSSALHPRVWNAFFAIFPRSCSG